MNVFKLFVRYRLLLRHLLLAHASGALRIDGSLGIGPSIGILEFHYISKINISEGLQNNTDPRIAIYPYIYIYIYSMLPIDM